MQSESDYHTESLKPEYQDILNGKVRLEGLERGFLLQKLAEEANNHHLNCQTLLKQSLDHAKRCGDALRVAKKLTGGRGKWGKWRDANFDGAPSTARAYMQVSRHWEDTRVKAYRADGYKPNSIKGLLDVIRGKHKDSKGDKSRAQRKYLLRIISLSKNWTTMKWL